jgi:hypothetical protein
MIQKNTNSRRYKEKQANEKQGNAEGDTSGKTPANADKQP